MALQQILSFALLGVALSSAGVGGEVPAAPAAPLAPTPAGEASGGTRAEGAVPAAGDPCPAQPDYLSGPAAEQHHAQLSQFFDSLDSNHDGEVDLAEAERYVGALQPSEEGWPSAGAAAQHIAHVLDGADQGVTISEQEIETHLQGLMQGHRVVDWVTHGLNLPQYAAAFRQNAITALDFPLLVNSGGALLQTELGMTSLLHQQQLLRGMKRLILGLGETPSPPRGLVCTSAGLGAGAGGSGGPGPINGGVGRSSGEGGGIRISWELPSQLGRPQFHKYVLQRQAVVLDGAGSGSAGGAGRSGGSSGTGNGYGAWDLVGEPDDEDTSWLDTLLAGASSRSGSASGWRYRLVAWNAYGPSDPAISPPCIVTRAAHDLPPTQQRLRQTAAAANAAALWMGTASGKRGGGAPSGASGGAAEAAATAAAAAALDTAAGMAPGQRLWAWPTLTSVLATVAALLYLWGMLTERQASEQQDQRAAGSASEQDCPVEAEQQQQQQQLVAPAPHAAEADSAAGEEARLSPFDVSEQQQRPDYGHVRHTSSAASLEELASGYSASPDPDVQVLPGAWRDEEELHLAVQRGLHCAHPGCHRRFDRLRDLKHKAQSHFCGLCQHVVCLEHTRVSPHGPLAGCGLDSACVCASCFAELAPVQQAAYNRLNRLPLPSAAAHGSGNEGNGGVNGTSPERVVSGPRASTGSRISFRRGSSNSLVGAAAAAAASSPDGSGGGSKSAARQRWAKAGTVLRAIGRFKKAGGSPN